MYRDFEIGTAKPTMAERSRVPHHLLDYVDPTAYITAGEYSRQARKVLEEIKTRAKDKAYLHRLLRRLDPAAATKIHAHDTPKLIRAIEVCLASRKEMSEMWKEGRDHLKGFDVNRLGLNPERTALYERINRRAQQMFDSG